MDYPSTRQTRNRSILNSGFLQAMRKFVWFSAIYLSLSVCCHSAVGQARIFVGQKPLDVGPFENIQDAFLHIQQNISDFPEGSISVVVEPGDYCENLQFPTVASVALLASGNSQFMFQLKSASCSQNKGGVPLEHTIRGFQFGQNNAPSFAVNVAGENCQVNVDECVIKNGYITGVLAAVGGFANISNTSFSNAGTAVFVAGGSRASISGGDVTDTTDAFNVAELDGQAPPQLDIGNGTVFEDNFGSGTVIGENAIVNIDDVELINNGKGFLVENAGESDGGSFLGPGQGLNITVTNCTFRGTSAADGGAITSVGDVNLMISNCLFETNSNTGVSAGNGSAIQLTGTNAAVMNCTFRNNLSNKGGGAIQCDDQANALISECVFENNRSDGSFDEGAGAIVCNGSNPMIVDCDFLENSARIEAGAIRTVNGSAPLIQNCRFNENTADRVAGAVFCQGNSMPMFVDCTFEMNMTTNASSDGGAVVVEGASPTFDTCTFQDNMSPDVGAALMEDSFSFPANVIFSNCNFSGNVGGTLEAFDAGLNLVDCQFINNLDGTVLSCIGSNTVMQNCQFDSNMSRAIFMNDSSSNSSALEATNCSFNNHVTDLDGAAMFAFDTTACFSNCAFTNNSSSPNGGALLMVNSDLVLKFCHLENNSATGLGGAVGCFNDTTGTFIGCVFAGNSSGTDGGAVFCSTAAMASYQSCAFSGNSSGNNGGSLVALGVPGDTISNCTFSNNSANNLGGAVFVDGDTVVTINNSILWENGPNPIQIQSGSTANVSFSNVQGGFVGTGNMDADPLFENALGLDGLAGTFDDDLRLQPISPMIDAGDNEAVPADEMDVDDDGDVAEPMPFDLNRMIRFADNPDMPDVGNGVAPIVDMGAIEFSNLLLGDVNLDGVVNLLDVDPFIDRVAQGIFQAEADTNQDGEVNLLDVGPFIAILAG